ncbi:MAG: PAS domain-containing protein [Burkholderiales bacterium]|nr:PAS domain-containing protein [Burkholderiales bacterium]
MRRNLEDRVRTIAGIAGLLALLAALAVLLGWELDIGWLKSAGAGPADMKPLTATCLACFGAALVFTDGLPRFPAGNRVGLGFAVVGTTIAVATLIEYGSGVELGFDRALFAEAVARSGLPYPGRMAPMSAVALTLLGSAILLRDRRSSTADTAGSLCLVIAGMICLLGLLGYLYGASSLYQVPAYSSMARHTALLVIVLVIATALSRPRRSLVEPFLAPGSGGVMARYVLPPSVALLIGLGWLRLFGESIGMYDTAFGLAVLVGAFVLIFGTLLWFVARSLNRQDDRTRAAEDLRMRLLESLDQASEAVIVLDAEGRINTWNAGASRLYGYTAAEAIGRYNIDLLTTPDMVD